MSPLQCKGQLDPAAQKQGEKRCDRHQAAHEGDAWYHGVLHKKEYIGDASREITHEDIPLVCRLMTVTALLTLLLSCGVKLPFAL